MDRSHTDTVAVSREESGLLSITAIHDIERALGESFGRIEQGLQEHLVGTAKVVPLHKLVRIGRLAQTAIKLREIGHSVRRQAS